MYRNEIQKQWLIMSNNCQRTPNGQSKMDNPEKLATQGTKTKKNKTKAQYNMCRTSLYVIINYPDRWRYCLVTW